MRLIWPSGEVESFRKRDWTGQITLIRLNKSPVSRNGWPYAGETHAAVAAWLLAALVGRHQCGLGTRRDHAGLELRHRDHLLKQESTRRRQPEPTGSTVRAIFSSMSRS
jgi:hypothetical protein